MAQLTQEYFDQTLGQTLKEQTQDLNSYVKEKLEEQTGELARMVKEGFDGVDTKLAQIGDMLDVRKNVDQLKEEVRQIKEKLLL
jgi:polyhydroxyalkanoate synthesis regulator phasin